MSSSRTQQLRHIASRLGMQFQEREEWGFMNYLLDFQLFRTGRFRRITNILHKKDDWLQTEIYIFDYKYVRGKGKHRKVKRQTVFFIQSKQLALPQFLMKPETFFHRVGEYLGMQDIDFEEYPVFSNHYLLRGEDENFIRATMSEEVLKFFTVEKNWSLEGVNYYLVLYQKNRLLQPKRIKNFYEKGMDLYKMLIYEPPTLE